MKEKAKILVPLGLMITSLGNFLEEKNALSTFGLVLSLIALALEICGVKKIEIKIK